MIHVFARPDHQQENDSRLCDEEDGGENVIYHAGSIVTEGGRWMCETCFVIDDQLPDTDVVVSRVL